MKSTGRIRFTTTKSLASISVCLGGVSSAQDALQTLEPLTVVGSSDAVFEMPRSAAYVDAEEFRERHRHSRAARSPFQCPADDLRGIRGRILNDRRPDVVSCSASMIVIPRHAA